MRRIRKNCSRALGVAVCQLLILQTLAAQAGTQAELQIIIVQGEGARNLVQQVPPEPLVVRVEDGGRPVLGATVIFTAPAAGPSGQFANGSANLVLTTDQSGLAVADGFHPNAIAGSYQIGVR